MGGRSATFGPLSDARAWRAEAQTALRGAMRAPARATLEEAANLGLLAVEAGVVRNRGGDRYKPLALRGYRQDLRMHALPRLGHLRLSGVPRVAIQDGLGAGNLF